MVVIFGGVTLDEILSSYVKVLFIVQNSPFFEPHGQGSSGENILE